MNKVLLVLSVIAGGCNYVENQEKKSENTMEKETSTFMPIVKDLVSSPLRNRLTLELNAPQAEVWALVGDPGRMPEYSAGLRAVETEKDSLGNCIGYTCIFKPLEDTQNEVIHHSKMKWYEKNKGWASVDDEDNPYGLLESLSIMTLHSENQGTILTWEFYFNCKTDELLKWNQGGYIAALTDISQRLLKRFGGRLLENQKL